MWDIGLTQWWNNFNGTATQEAAVQMGWGALEWGRDNLNPTPFFQAATETALNNPVAAGLTTAALGVGGAALLFRHRLPAMPSMPAMPSFQSLRDKLPNRPTMPSWRKNPAPQTGTSSEPTAPASSSTPGDDGAGLNLGGSERRRSPRNKPGKSGTSGDE